jgi:hypothetical protein
MGGGKEPEGVYMSIVSDPMLMGLYQFDERNCVI